MFEEATETQEIFGVTSIITFVIVPIIIAAALLIYYCITLSRENKIIVHHDDVTVYDENGDFKRKTSLSKEKNLQTIIECQNVNINAQWNEEKNMTDITLSDNPKSVITEQN